MPPLYDLEILTPEQVLFDGRTSSLVAPGAEGYLGVMARHAPMVVKLAIGELAVEEEGRRRLFAVSGGFLTVAGNRATVLADTAEPAERIDRERARAAMIRARQRLEERGPELEVARAEGALRRALNRMRVYEKWRPS